MMHATNTYQIDTPPSPPNLRYAFSLHPNCAPATASRRWQSIFDDDARIRATILRVPEDTASFASWDFCDGNYEAFLWRHLLQPTRTILIYQNPYSIEKIRALHLAAVQELRKSRGNYEDRGEES